LTRCFSAVTELFVIYKSTPIHGFTGLLNIVDSYKQQ